MTFFKSGANAKTRTQKPETYLGIVSWSMDGGLPHQDAPITMGGGSTNNSDLLGIYEWMITAFAEWHSLYSSWTHNHQQILPLVSKTVDIPPQA